MSSDESWPPPALDTIDWDNVGFKVREVNGHIESHYSVKTGQWTKPEFVKDPFLRIHGFAPVINYGQQAFEGLKCYRNPDENINVFRANKNAARFAHSAEVLAMPPVPEDLFVQCVHLAIGLNAEHVPPHRTGAAMYIRPLIFGSCAQLGLNPPEEYMFVVYVVPTGVYHGSKPVDALIMEDFDRAAPEGTGHAKVGGNYAPVIRHSQRAYGEGFGITLHLDSKTRSEVDEFSTAGFIGFHKDGDDVTLVVPDSKCVIESVTSTATMEVARNFGWKVEKRSIPYEEIGKLSEVAAAGTAAGLVPIRSITMRSRGDKFVFLQSDEPGPCVHKIWSTLKGIQQGKIADTLGFNAAVKAPQPGTYSVRKEATEGSTTNGVAPQTAGQVQAL